MNYAHSLIHLAEMCSLALLRGMLALLRAARGAMIWLIDLLWVGIKRSSRLLLNFVMGFQEIACLLFFRLAYFLLRFGLAAFSLIFFIPIPVYVLHYHAAPTWWIAAYVLVAILLLVVLVKLYVTKEDKTEFDLQSWDHYARGLFARIAFFSTVFGLSLLSAIRYGDHIPKTPIVNLIIEFLPVQDRWQMTKAEINPSPTNALPDIQTWNHNNTSDYVYRIAATTELLHARSGAPPLHPDLVISHFGTVGTGNVEVRFEYSPNNEYIVVYKAYPKPGFLSRIEYAVLIRVSDLKPIGSSLIRNELTAPAIAWGSVQSQTVWSPDGRYLLFPMQDPRFNRIETWLLVDLETGQQDVIQYTAWSGMLQRSEVYVSRNNVFELSVNGMNRFLYYQYETNRICQLVASEQRLACTSGRQNGWLRYSFVDGDVVKIEDYEVLQSR